MSDQTSPSDDLDYGDDAKPSQVAIDAAFEQLETLVAAEQKALDRVASATAELAAAQAAYKQITERDIPDLLVAMRQTSLTTYSGAKVTIKREIRGSLPSGKERPLERAQAIKWLSDNGHGALVKNKILVELDRGEDARADACVQLLKAEGYDAAADKDVHAGTLSKLIRELYTAGLSVPTKLLNVYDQKIAIITRKP